MSDQATHEHAHTHSRDVDERRSEQRAESKRLIKSLFENLEGPDIWIEQYDARQTVFRREETADRMWYVVSGVVEEWRGDARVSVLNAGDMLGDITHLAPQALGKRMSTAVCVTDVVLKSMPFERMVQMLLTQGGEEMRLLTRKLLRHGGKWARGTAEALQTLTHHRFGGQRSVLVPPDYLLYPADSHIIPCQLPDEVRRQLPPFVDIRLNREGRPWCMLIVSHYSEMRPHLLTTSGKPLSFSEAMLMVPVWTQSGKPAFFQMWAFPNNVLSMFKAREVFGQPKMYGNHYIEPIEGSETEWRISGRSAGTPTLDMRIEYIPWAEIGADLVELMSAIMPTDVSGGVMATEEFQARSELLKARIAEYEAQDEDGRRLFRWHRAEEDPQETEYWGQYIGRAYLEWLQARGQGLPDPLAWAVPRNLDHRLGSAAQNRSNRGDEGSPRTLFSMTRFLPEEMNDNLILAWKRNYRPEVETVSSYMKWTPEDFSVDQITRTHVTNLANHRVDLFRVHDRIITFQVGERVLELRPLLRLQRKLSSQEGREVDVELCFGFRNSADLMFRACRGHVGEPAVDLDYLQADTILRLNEARNAEIRKRLDWGPDVWDVEGGTPVAPLPRVEPVHIDAELPPLPAEGRPDRDLIAARILAALGQFDTEAVKQGMPLSLEGVKKMMDVLVPAGQEPKIHRLGAEELLFSPGDKRDICWMVMAGSIEEWRHDAWVGDRSPGLLIGEDPVLADLPRDTEARAQVDSVLLEIDGEALRDLFETNDPLLRGVVARLSWWCGQHQIRMALEAGYQLDTTSYQCFPGARAVVLPGPYDATNIELLYILVQRPLDGLIESHLPPGVSWHPSAPVGILMFARFENFGPSNIDLDTGGGAAYTETGLMIPAMVDGQAGETFQIYVPWIFPSNIAAMFAGRELYGYPKTYANTIFDDENGRVILRRKGKNQTVFHYEQVDWGQIGLRDVGHMAACFKAAAGVPWEDVLRVNQDNLNWTRWQDYAYEQPKGPDPHRTPVTGPLMSMAGAYLNRVVPRLVPWVPESLRKLSVACWKRNFSPSARYPSSELRAEWTKDVFDVDSIAGSGFLVTGLSDMTPIRINEHEGIVMTWEPEDDLSPHDTPYVQVLQPLGKIGLRLKYDMSMTTGSTLIDYNKEPKRDRARLQFGPHARRRDDKPET
jgi:CRP-like cAMP-binding protein